MDNITHEDILNEEIITILQKYDLEIKFLNKWTLKTNYIS